jgi:hypothetical protein
MKYWLLIVGAGFAASLLWGYRAAKIQNDYDNAMRERDAIKRMYGDDWGA